ncbi:Protein kinase-like domain [Pseudocohnilembus persalinus]|uniref:Protein kinase-like domain n=1 Tax=Pseudocohnilembus persalinus TaxID=266149 RepID=A0A0V0R935_PSEPJ|nr:Protein kinase-like domain [Pseudocohnilembus persalinus]|eukprot:KRX10773.1 Protein kinase-like domain [Pseudocohnilembus persalinus]
MPSDRDIPSLLNPLFHNHGKQETLQFTQLAKKFDLDFTPYLMSIRVKILVGEVVVSKIEETKKIPFNTRPVFNQWITWNNLKYSQLSLETKLAFDVIVYNSADEYYGICNKKERPPDELIYDRQKREQFLSKNYGRIAVELEAFQSPMYWSLKCQKTSQLLYQNQNGKREIDFLSLHSDPNDIAKLKDLLEKDPLNRNWTTQERIILFTCREFYKTLPEGLDFFISSLKPNEPLHYREAYQKIEEWAPPQIEHCLTFLDAQHGDDIIRNYAVNKLSQLSNDEIKIFILEFIQALIFENNHYSPLCELLLERALLSPCIVGREFFWGLRSQLHIKPTFEENQQIMLMFKDGDDIRQDQLVLQLISIMDKIWLDNGLDFRMNIYKVLPTKDQVGMIEVVTNSETTAAIHKKKGVFAAWEDSGFHEFLKEFNPTEQDYQNCITNFVHSCAGYCIATYILGIGDRHSDNIMLQKTGNLFHIDFGHFLGHFKVKYGIKRERTPFVFTEEMCYVMGGTGGELYKSFEEMCCKGYNLIRKHGHFIINIFKLMLSAGIPELQNAENIEYLNMILSLELSEQQAAAKFRKELKNTLKDTFKSLDNMIHEIVTN